MPEIKLDMVITNADDILATAKRINEISKELTTIAYKLQAEIRLKKQPEE